MVDRETLQIDRNHRLLHAPHQGAIKYQSKRPPGDWHTQANLEYRAAQAIGEFLAQIREAHDIEQWLEDGDDDG